MFRKMRGSKLPYMRQGLIYFVCQNFRDMPPEVQQRIVNLCLQCGGQHYQALFEAVTTQRSMLKISMDHYIDESWLYQLRLRFFAHW